MQILIDFYELWINYYTSADEVENKKPAPDVFNKTFEKMWALIESKRIVIGDWISDVIWWKAAWAQTIYVGTSAENAKNNWATLCIPSFTDLTLDTIYSL